MNVESVQMSLYLFQASIFTWIRVASPCILFGLYYGLLSTLPIGPSHIISIRSFLLKGNASGFAAFSGLIIGQLILFLSIFYSPLYILIIKPHVITLLIVPYMLLYWFRTKDLLDYRISHPIDLLIDSRIYNIFLESFLLQILNPILLPSPVLARLIHLFLFRYSNNVMFLISTFMGWLIGHILFISLSRLLVVRLQSDSPILYVLIKRIIHNTFSIIIYINVLLYLGKAPVSLFTHKIEDRFVLLEENFYELPDWILWMFKQWPTSYFDQYRPNRPIRYITSWFSGNNPVKRQVSTHFFDKCLSDGKERITFTALPSLSIFENQLQLLEPFKKKEFNVNPYKHWISGQSIRKEALINELKDRIQSLDTNWIVSKTIERRAELVRPNNEKLPKPCNPFLSNLYRIKFPISRSFWILYDLLKSGIDNKIIETNNKYTEQYNDYAKIEDWISNRYQQLSCDNIPLPWETIPPRAQDIFLFMFEDSKDIRIQQIFEEIDLVYKEEDLSSVWEVTWEQVFQLPLPERTLFFICLQEDCNGFDWIDLLDISSIDKKRYSYSKQRIHSIYKIEEMVKELTENSQLILDNPFDIVGGVTDIRNRKLKNLGISIEKNISKPKRIIKRFSETPDFRRELIKGSMRSRRRKMLVWNLFQEKAHSPFFLRLIEIPTLSQPSVKRFFDSKRLTINPEQETNKEFEQQLSSSSSLKNGQIMRSLISARLDVSSIHTGRSLLLVLQSNLRKYVKLPILITFKNLVRIFLFQAPEWNEDWNECHKESHINCTYDGEEFSDTDLPARWLKEGLQIKIVHPFQLKPWHNHKKKQSIIRGSKINLKDIPVQRSRKKSKSEKESFQATYLTIWGFQTDRPFGTIRKEPSFWKPIKREFIKNWKNSLSLRTTKIGSFFSRLGISMKFGSSVRKGLNPLDRFRVIQENPRQNNTIDNNTFSETKQKGEKNSGKIDRESIHIPNVSQSIIGIENKSVSDAFGGSELKTGFPIYQSNTPLLQKIGTDEQSIKRFHLNKVEIDKRLRNTNAISPLSLKKKLIDIRRRSLILRIGITKFIDKYLSIAMFLQPINRILSHYSVTLMTFQIQLVRVIKNIIDNNLDIEESTLAIPDTDKKMFQVNNRSIGSFSQAYIYDSFWYTNGTDNVDLNDLMNILKDNGIPKECRIQKELDKDSGYKEEWNSEGDNDRSENGDLSTKRKKQDLLGCLDNKNKVIQEYIDEPIKDLVMTQGLSKQLFDLTANDWENWLGSFKRYNLPLEVWRKIAPQGWRVNVESLNRFEEIGRNFFDNQDKYVYHEDGDNFCFYIENPLLRDRIKNLNKLHKYTNLLSNLVNSLQRRGSEVLKNRIKQKDWWKNRIKNLVGRKKRKSFYQQISNLENELISKTDLALWIIPDVINNKKLSKTRLRSIFGPKTCILKSPLFDSLLNGQFDLLNGQIDLGMENESFVRLDEMFLRDRLTHYFLSQWKWKSETLYKRLKRFKDILSLINILQDKHDLTAYIDIDPDLINLFFGEDNNEILEDLFTFSGHRFSRIFDDQILMYKLVNILLRFKNRFRKRLDRDIFDECKLRLLFMDERIDFSYLYNIDDLLLPKRSRESQILGSMGIPKYLLDSPFQIQETSKGEESKDSSKIQIIKRFLWPSHRLEELACINRFYLNTNNGSRFTILKIRMYTIL
uniref:conserved hypothetical protein ycf1 n=1 Tax=Trichomanes auriculatum TaxID=381226 RepID=UPI0028D3FEFC|nr:conserved hypothetical protein ycf1 [Vandenboschia auriculata]ALO81805.1 conserved hypothetical protein ycf1 [Vandenboschia auriculata]